MRALLLGFVGALSLAVVLPAADAAPSGRIATLSAPVSQQVPIASHKCGQGQHWVPGAYAKHGKYRAGHCAPN
jgi:hypothetical protein